MINPNDTIGARTRRIQRHTFFGSIGSNVIPQGSQPAYKQDTTTLPWWSKITLFGIQAPYLGGYQDEANV